MVFLQSESINHNKDDNYLIANTTTKLTLMRCIAEHLSEINIDVLL